ncbi:MAG: RNA polymerase factor sigma-54 [Planctomycetes bacterium]|nr:RNA polymerase factor sigma-54 [Planctomycetota bacterium]
MKLGLHQSARLDQRLVQSPQMIQAMKILQLGALDLLERIDQELVENPMLEEAPREAEAEAEGGPREPSENRDSDSAAVERMLDDLERIQRDFGDGTRATSGDGDEGDRKLAALANAPDEPHSMAEAMHEELAFLDLTDRERAIAEFVISSLDERGYLQDGIEELAADCPLAFLHRGEEGQELPPAPGDEPGDDEVSPEELNAVLIRLRGLIHPALGARDLREALLLQIDHFEQEDPLLRAIVSDHLEDVQQNRLPRIAKATGASLDEIKEALEHLKRLDPAPGAQYGGSTASVILPDVIVELVDGEYVVRLDRERVPRLQLSPTYRRLLESSQKGDEAQVWLKKRLESARWFIDAVAQRQSTLERIAVVIFRHQRPFLEKGLTALQPLRMQEVADEVGVHISTVSRAVSGKYAQTPRGIFPLKFFFTGGTTKGTGEVASQVSIQQYIKRLVEDEDPEHPLSDEELAKRLFEKHNVKIARRTVTKYRKLLDIPSSSVRKAF